MLRTLREILAYRQLIRHLVVSDLKVRYRKSLLGLLWTLLNPLLLTGVFWVVFSRFGKVSEKSYALFLLSGLMAWLFFQQSIEQSLNSVIKHRSLMQKIYLPKIVFPLTTVVANFVNMLFFLCAYLALAVLTPVGVHGTLLLLIPVMLMLFIMALGGSLIMCTLNIFFRDFTHLTSVILRAGFYLTPVLYRPGIFESDTGNLLRLNPMFYPVVATRDVLYDGSAPGAAVWGIGFAAGLVLLCIGLVVFKSNEDKFIYYA